MLLCSVYSLIYYSANGPDTVLLVIRKPAIKTFIVNETPCGPAAVVFNNHHRLWAPYHILYFSLKLRTVPFFCRHQHEHSKVHNSAPYQETVKLNTWDSPQHNFVVVVWCAVGFSVRNWLEHLCGGWKLVRSAVTQSHPWNASFNQNAWRIISSKLAILN